MNTVLYWFRNDLRVTDNPGLLKACEAERVIAVYCFNPKHFENTTYGFPKTGPFRTRFRIESLKDLKHRLDELNISLFVYQDQPFKILPKLIKQLGITSVFLQREWTSEECEERDAVKSALDTPISFHEIEDGFLFHPDDLPYKTTSAIPEIFTEFRKRCEKLCAVREPLPPPVPKEPSNRLAVPDNIPELSAFNFIPIPPEPRSAFPFSGGSAVAWERIENYFWKDQRLSFYKHTRNGLVGTAYSTKLSPWLADGSLSAREVYAEVKKYERLVIKNQDTYWLIFELIWRDYFRYISRKHGNRIFGRSGIRNTLASSNTDAAHLQQWTCGATKNDFINANMIELLKTGWMSNRGRQNVASYWVRHLRQDWRIGAAWFEYLLVDYDVHSNWCNWMYNSGVGNDPRDRTFNPDLQASRYDADGQFRKRWLQPTLFDLNPEA
ncbi:DASH family cryptochrome [Robiginitalea sp.]|nr:DASH family cryptochrome [Robiginitalea sp.]